VVLVIGGVQWSDWIPWRGGWMAPILPPLIAGPWSREREREREMGLSGDVAPETPTRVKVNSSAGGPPT